LTDAFVQAGRGWGGTHLNELPILRIDQVWLSGEWRALSVTAHRTRNSDHRVVVCDISLGAVSGGREDYDQQDKATE